MSSIPMKEDDTLSQDHEVKRAAEMREWIEEKISELEQEVSRLRDMLMLVDSTLRRKSFVSAKELRGTPAIREARTSANVAGTIASNSQAKRQIPEEIAQMNPKTSISLETRELRRTKDGELLAKATIGTEKIVITPAPQIKLSGNISPFQSFFVNRILKGYQSKDIDASKSGNLSATEVLQYNVREIDGFITEITVTNYRDKSRLNEILSTSTWAFTRMLEK